MSTSADAEDGDVAKEKVISDMCTQDKVIGNIGQTETQSRDEKNKTDNNNGMGDNGDKGQDINQPSGNSENRRVEIHGNEDRQSGCFDVADSNDVSQEFVNLFEEGTDWMNVETHPTISAIVTCENEGIDNKTGGTESNDEGGEFVSLFEEDANWMHVNADSTHSENLKHRASVRQDSTADESYSSDDDSIDDLTKFLFGDCKEVNVNTQVSKKQHINKENTDRNSASSESSADMKSAGLFGDSGSVNDDCVKDSERYHQDSNKHKSTNEQHNDVLRSTVAKQISNSIPSVLERAISDDSLCCICLDRFENPKVLSKCSHKFCADCIDQHFKVKPVCPVCFTVYGIITGTQPVNGEMDHHVVDTRLLGYSGCQCIVINYSFENGTQTAEHPYPGKPYYGTSRTAYLPDNTEGRKVLRLLLEAFKRRLVFTVGMSRTTGADHQVTWNDIHHKTCTSGGQQGFGYPDPTYLSRVQEELAAFGVTEESLTQST